MRLGIDLDGVVANFNAGWIGRYNEDFGSDLHPDMVTTWGAMVPLTHFETMAEFWRWSAGGDDRPSVFRNLDTYPGAVETLWALRRRGHDIVILSTKPGFAVHDTFHWIADKRLPTREVHLTDDKAAVACDVYLEDALHQLEAMAAHRPDATVCRFIRPWNHSLPGVLDVSTWEAFAQLIAEIE